MPTISLPMDPDLGQLRKKARELQRAVRSGDPDALALVAEFHPDGPPSATFQLSAAQLVLARQYGFASWPRLRRHVEIVTSSTWQPTRSAPREDLAAAFLRLSCGGYPLTGGEDPAAPWTLRPRIWRDLRGARELLAQHPELPVGFQNSVMGPDVGFYAARSYSLMRPPRTGRRWIRSWERSATGWSGWGGRSRRLRCGRRPL